MKAKVVDFKSALKRSTKALDSVSANFALLSSHTDNSGVLEVAQGRTDSSCLTGGNAVVNEEVILEHNINMLSELEYQASLLAEQCATTEGVY